jgi:branched-chain amino acid transport system ATP-binding protein
VALLEVNEIIVRFGGLQALSEPSLEVEPGRISGLIGPNGAGKTTLFNVVTGLQAPVKGSVHLDGKDITTTKPHKRARLGIARTFQRLEVFGSLSARENVLVAAEMRRGWSKEKFDPGVLADELIARVGLAAVAEEPVAALPTGTARLVELARALATKPSVLLLDEPSSGLNEEETHEMGALLKQLAGDGLAVLLVEHDMPFVMATCDHIDVLDFGAIIARGTPSEIQANSVVQSAYLGAASVETAEAVVHADAGGPA